MRGRFWGLTYRIESRCPTLADWTTAASDACAAWAAAAPAGQPRSRRSTTYWTIVLAAGAAEGPGLETAAAAAAGASAADEPPLSLSSLSPPRGAAQREGAVDAILTDNREEVRLRSERAADDDRQQRDRASGSAITASRISFPHLMVRLDRRRRPFLLEREQEVQEVSHGSSPGQADPTKKQRVKWGDIRAAVESHPSG
jgi:hypothetical protein